jgi:hypothetical protein
VQWTFSDILMEDFFLDMAVKGFLTKTTLNYNQTISGVNATIDFSDDLLGAQFLVSKKLMVFEPYVGLGFVKAKGDITVTASAPVFFFANQATSASSKPTSSQLLAGLDVRLLFLSLGVEYEKAFGSHGVTGRLSFRF